MPLKPNRHRPCESQPRLKTAERGYGGRWQRYRLLFLRENPLCVECLKTETTTEATVVDHIRPHKGDYDLFWSSENHQAMCKRCHDVKTATEDGGFGADRHG
jgi:5-methylcytosine-specific restriction protein A